MSIAKSHPTRSPFPQPPAASGHRARQRRRVFLVLCLAGLWLLGGPGLLRGQTTNRLQRPPSAPAQKSPTPPTRPSPPVRTLTPAMLQRALMAATNRVSPGAARPATDPLLNLMMQQPAIDIESPAMVLAQFDPPIITVGGYATYRVVITALKEVIKMPESLPAPRGLEVVPGGRGQAFFNLGSKMQPRTTINYRVRAQTPGHYTIPPYSVTVGGKFVQVPAARLRVVGPGSAGVPEVPKLTIQVPETNLYVGASVPINLVITDPGGNTVRGLTRVEVTSESFMVDTTFYRQRRQTITRGNQRTAAIIQEMYVTPLKAGKQELRAQGQAIMARPTAGQPVQLPGYYPLVDAEPVTVTVKRLPKEGELPGFTGAIGTFSLQPPRISAKKVRAGEPVTLTLTVQGKGNIARLLPPKLEGLWDWQTFEPMSDSAQPQIIQQRGFTTFNYTMIPLSDQITATPTIPFCYFDPAKQAYVDLTIPPVPLEVEPAAGGVDLSALGTAALSASSGDGLLPEERSLVMNGLSETPGILASTLLPVQQRSWFLALLVLPGLVLGGIWLWDRRRRFLAQHPEVILKSRARRGLRRYERLLRQAVNQSDPGGFVRAAVNALRQACAPHAAANPDALVCGDVLREISPPEREGKTGEIVRRLFTAADLLQFGGALPDGPQILGLKSDLERLLQELRAKL